jgi:hypothetical protein
VGALQWRQRWICSCGREVWSVTGSTVAILGRRIGAGSGKKRIVACWRAIGACGNGGLMISQTRSEIGAVEEARKGSQKKAVSVGR